MKFDPVRLLQYRAACRRREARLHEAFLRRQRRRKAEEERRRMEKLRAECERRFPERLAAQEHNDGLITVMLVDSDGIRRATLLTPDMDPPPSPIIFGNGYFHDGWARKHEVKRTGPLTYRVTVLRAVPCCGDCTWVEESVWHCRRKEDERRREAEEEYRRMEASRAECERLFPERLAARERNDGLIPVMLTDSDGFRRATLLTADMDPPPSPVIFSNSYFHDGFARKHNVERTGLLTYNVTVLRAKPCCGDYVWVEESVWRCRREGNPRTLPA